METQLFTMRPLDLRNASDHEYACLHHFTMQLQGEAFPEDPPTALTEAIIGWRSIPANITPGAWVVWDADGNQIIAFGEAYLLSTDPDQADFRIGVLPAYRRRGVAHQLLAPIVDFTEQQGRIRLGTDTNDRVPTGAVFLERMGGQARFWAHFNQLHLADLNYKLLEQWGFVA
jgi:GNAT superfamily N-acetyltransferase